ncbi:spore coat protein [Bacillus sp. ISL-51]|uniref:spore coat protein n=1 Tax=Bacteria TaxID=2 RepID=UPI001BEC201A|nr:MULTISPECIES: spore coat protein [Bacteria]MBT2575555.1 spore coat protein [Bacillus sp. ISL-51]MBT2635177.1 spore coat protein [Bacillus sp. ISL-26]MBT2711356.1 spore coat protein [Pseudomonas sp. ISL-88]
MNDFLDPKNSIGMPDLADSALALEFLLSVKSGIKDYAIAITETATPELRQALRTQLDTAIQLHGELSQLMIKKGWLSPTDTKKQFALDLKSAQTAVDIAGLKLFPDNTNRLGTFATPYN